MEAKIIKTFTSKTGREIVIRYPSIEDTEILMNYINTVSKERTFISFQGEQQTLAEETVYLQQMLKSIMNNTAVMALTFDGDKLIGNSAIEMGLRTERHIGTFGISIAADYRGDGIGRMLMDGIISEALQKIPELEILSLSVYATNGRACALYESFGFVKYGMLPRGVKREDGYVDHVYMFKRVR